MKKRLAATLIGMAGILGGLSIAFCGTSSTRVIPDGGALGVLRDGKEIIRFSSEVPLPEGQLVSHGRCVIQGQKYQLMAHDKTVFSLAPSENESILNIKSGQIDYALREDAKLTFESPAGTYRSTRIIPASPGALARGTVSVTPEGTVFTASEGEVRFASANSLQEFSGAASGGAGAAAAASAGGASGGTGATAAATAGGAATMVSTGGMAAALIGSSAGAPGASAAPALAPVTGVPTGPQPLPSSNFKNPFYGAKNFKIPVSPK